MTVYVKQNSLIVNTYFLLVLRFVLQEYGKIVEGCLTVKN